MCNLDSIPKDGLKKPVPAIYFVAVNDKAGCKMVLLAGGRPPGAF